MSKRFYPKARRVNVLVTTSEMKQENFMGEWKLKMLKQISHISCLKFSVRIRQVICIT